MSLQTNVPQITWTPQGLVVPSEAEVLAGVLLDWNAAFGGNLNTTNLQTPQGQLASSQAACISNQYALYAQMVTWIDPDLNSGFAQDAIGRIYYMNRSAGTSTLVTCNCIGLQGTVIPTGSPQNPQAIDQAGNLYYCIAGGAIPTSGTLSLVFANCITGPIACPAGTLTGIYNAIAGWDQITNPANGVVGNNTQSAESFEFQREQSLQANAQGTTQAVLGAVLQLSGVSSAFAIENTSSSAVEYGPTNYSLAANSIYVGVVGGTPAQIAQAIWSKKGPGCNYNGNQTVTVYDTSYPAGQQPAYSVKYNVPNSIPMSCVVTLSSAANLPSNINALIQAAVLALFDNGQQASGLLIAVPPVGIGSLILSANYYPAILATAAGVPLISVTWGTLFSGTGSLTSSSTTLTISAVTSGYLAPGDVVMGTGIPSTPPTTIVEQLSGTPGGVGTYEMSAEASANETGEAIASATGTNTQFQAGIDQYLTLATANITIVT